MTLTNDYIVHLLENQVRKDMEDVRVNSFRPAVSVFRGQKVTCAAWVDYMVDSSDEKREPSCLDDVPIMDLYKHFSPEFKK